jgi:hypothetical protein
MEPSRVRPGDTVTLKRGTLAEFPTTTVVLVDELQGKAMLRFSRPNGEGYSYLFWRDLADIERGVSDDGSPFDET